MKNPSGNETFKILKIGAKIFSDSQAKYLVANVFNTEHRSEVYSIGAQKTADNGCVQDTLFTIKLNPLPVFSLGADINANGFTMLNIRAKSDEPNYFWNLPNIGNKDRIQGMASTFNFQAGSNPIICKVIDKNSCQWSDTLVIQFSTNLKTMDVLEARLFPNPASQKIVFEWDKTINPNGFKIFDLTGKSLPLHPWTAQGNQITLDLSNYPQGMYILQFQADEKIHFTQFSILRP